jgi:DNA-binding transcriptional MerR regulator
LPQIDFSKLKKLYYTIGEVGTIFNVNTSLIRFWEKEFNFKSSKKTQSGNRLYSAKDIENFNKIYHLVKEEGFTIDGAKKALNSPKKEILTNTISNNLEKEKLIEKLEAIKITLLKLK